MPTSTTLTDVLCSAPFSVVLALTVSAIGCSSRNADDLGSGGSSSSSGGASTQGGTSSSAGGAVASGGALTQAGTTAVAGSATGGVTSGGNTGSGGSSTAAGTTGIGGTYTVTLPPAPTEACPDLALDENQQIATYATDRFTWNDAECKARTTALVRAGGGYVRQVTYDTGGESRTVTGTGVNGHTGWGYTVDHFGNGATVGKDAAGTFEPLFVGKHHAIYQYEFSINVNGQNIPVTQHWFFATGRSNPILATTYDMTGNAKGSIVADIRTPYGDMAWEGDGTSTDISGVGWGDRYKFITTKEPLTLNSTWDYTVQNQIPYVLEWTTGSNAEMGAVQTQTYEQHDAGGYWFYPNWGQSSASQTKTDGQLGVMPESWNWPYQLNQYELCFPANSGCLDTTTGSHRMAWGTNYGALGGAEAGSDKYAAYGDDKQIVGYPYQSFSVFMVLGTHETQPVFAQVAEMDAVQATTLTASIGTVNTKAPGGVGRSDEITLAPAGFDARYSAWSVAAAANHVKFEAAVSSSAIIDPVLVVTGFTGVTPPGVTVNGTAATADIDYLMSLDTENQQLWVTFRPGWTGTQEIEIQ